MSMKAWACRVKTFIEKPRPQTKRTKWLVRALAVAMSVLAIAGLGANMALADDEDLSFYAVASSVSSYFTASLNPDTELEISSSWEALQDKPGTAGSVLGYTDQDRNLAQWAIAQFTVSSQVIEYSSLDAMGDGVREYAEFGATLSGLGLDNTRQGFGTNLINLIAGGSIMIAWLGASALIGLFSIVLWLLKWLNPFQLMFAGVNSLDTTLADGMVAGQQNEGWVADALTGVTSYIGGIYTVVQGLSWAVLVPLFIAATLIFAALGKARGGAFKKLFVRLLFIGVGIPLLGSMYTSVLQTMSDSTSGNNTGAAQVVASTFVDFEGWALKSRLAVPSGATIVWDRSEDQPSTLSFVEVQNTAREINAMVHPDELEGMQPLFTLGSNQADWADVGSNYNESQVSQDTDTASGVLSSLLRRYMMGDTVESASFGRGVQSDLTNVPTATSWFEELIDDDLNIDVGSNPLVNVSSAMYTARDTSGANDLVYFHTPGAAQHNECGSRVVSGGEPVDCSMSALSMYNYLNSSFRPTAMTVYSPDKVASEAVLEVHDSVTLVGTGVSSLIYWLNAFALLASFAILGIGYAIGMLTGTMKRGIKMITATPFAMLGAIGAITKVIVHVITMILEIIVTIFLYMIIQELLLAIPRLFSHLSSELINNRFTLFMGPWAAFVPFIGVLMVMAFTLTALRLRKSVVKAISEVATKVIEAVTGGSESNHAPAGGGGVQALAGGAAAGAGMAAGMKVAGGSSAQPSADGAGPAPASAGGTADGSVDVNGQGSGGPALPAGGVAAIGAPGGGAGPSGGQGPFGQGGTSGGSSSSETSRSSHDADAALGGQVQAKGLTTNPAGGGMSTPPPVVGGSASKAVAGDIGGKLAMEVVSSGSSTGPEKGGSAGDSRGVPSEPRRKPDTSGGGPGDMVDTAHAAFDEDNEARKDIAKDKRKAVTGGAEAVGQAGVAVLRAKSGDVSGAVSDGTAALGKAQDSVQKAQGAKAKTKSLDAQSTSAQSQTAHQSTGMSSQPRQSSGGSSAPAVQKQPPPRQRSGSGPQPTQVAPQRNVASGQQKPAPAPKPRPQPQPQPPKRTLPVTPD